MKITRFFLSIMAGICLLFVCAICGCDNSNAQEYINDTIMFEKALQRGDKIIYVDDLNFDKERTYTLNHCVNIIGKKEKSIISNVHFVIEGTNVGSENFSIVFENIKFDGKVEKGDYDFETKDKSFYEMFGNTDRKGKECIYGDYGYFNLTISNCEITKYASYMGPAIFVKNSDTFRDGKRNINLNSCSFYDNICYEGTVSLAYDNGTYNVNKCEFYNNTSKQNGGMILSNGKANVTNTKIYNNQFYRFAYKDAEGNVKYPDDKMFLRNRYFNYISTTGSLYIGSADARVDNCEIIGNHTLFGGGIGFNTCDSVSEGQKIEFSNCKINNNVAECGGAIYGRSSFGKTVKLINCQIFGNTANQGGIMYATSAVPYKNDKMRGGVIDFVFCSMAENKDTDSNSFSFYEVIMAKITGVVELHGCFVLDNVNYTLQDNNYSYLATKEQAIADNVITEEDIAKMYENGLCPKRGSKGDIKVPAKTFSTWSERYQNTTEYKRIGYIEPTKTVNNFPYWTIIFPILVIGIGIYCVVYFKKKKLLVANKTIDEEIAVTEVDYSEYSIEKIENKVESIYGGILTRKEIAVASFLLLKKSRKEIAQKLVVSDETVKTHISNILKKTNVSSKVEFKKITDKKIGEEKSE